MPGPETSQSLEDYIQRIPGHEHFYDKHEGAVKHESTSQLQPGVLNRILFYPGSFNPPHISHLALLQHIMKSGSDMNFIATVIFPADDAFIEKKLGEEAEDFILSKEERVRLWRGHGRDAPFWTYGGSIMEWQAFKAELIQEVAKDGFQLDISVLGGPDRMVDVDKGPPGQWGYNEWVFSDFSRDIEDYTPGSAMKQLESYEPWTPVVMNRKKSRQAAETVVSYIIAGMYMTGPKNTANMLKKVPSMKEPMIEDWFNNSESSTSTAWVCRRKDSPKATMLFIPKVEDEEESEAPRTSSSAIRELIKNAPPGKLEGRLSGKVLHPDILCEILSERGLC
ncbi:hypothetical protein N7456_013265 [Penicillium angulare]|uniref:Cytidyltransferase-like domain-containing protein n=1 Tax=Penicillium angulare TaxID=116970 RepID=A0A9W9EL34_9EURO|nr:hypothetical protein N7456_013265 [Penicillium angulare]